MIHTIKPYKFGAAWVFDDPSKGLSREALIAGTDELCDILSGGKDSFILQFSDEPFPGSRFSARLSHPEFGGNWYYSLELDKNFWLCKELYRFFPEAPGMIFFKALPDSKNISKYHSLDNYTYISKQETECAMCGKRKHTPLRNDTMGGYICLTCIDQELEKLQATLTPEEND